MCSLSHRSAVPSDVPHLVEFVLMAGEGLPEIAWSEMAASGQSLREVGALRAARDEGGFSWRNATVFERGGVPLAGMVGFALPEKPVEIGSDYPSAFAPLQELENLACGSWYVNILGTYPENRGQGIGTAMLACAEEIARETGCNGTSIIVFSANPGAERLYRRTGYREIARRSMSVPGWQHDGCEAILLVKD